MMNESFHGGVTERPVEVIYQLMENKFEKQKSYIEQKLMGMFLGYKNILKHNKS